ncbi:MAG: hypothetical protein QM811_11645 [Pirellulales bacterium]
MSNVNPYEPLPGGSADRPDPGEIIPMAKLVEAATPTRTVATFKYALQAQTALVALKNQGFQAQVMDETITTLGGIFGQAAYGWIKLNVAVDQAEAARAYLESVPGLLYEQGHGEQTMSDDACLACGAIIPPDQDSCPMCGWSFDMGVENESEETGDEEEDERLM